MSVASVCRMTKTDTRYTKMSELEPESQEDQIAELLMGLTDTPTDYQLEVHYNHYGDRGVVDLVVEKAVPYGVELTVHEIKSESAVDGATGANEIIRQFKRHRQYFLKGSDYGCQRVKNVNYVLTFYASDMTLNHIKANAGLYESICGEYKNNVQIRHPSVSVPGMPLVKPDVCDEWANKRHFADILESVDND